MATKDPRIDAYIAAAAPFAREILTFVRAAVHEGCPGVAETMKWSSPFFDYQGPLCHMAAFKEHCRFGFWKSPLLQAAGLPAPGMSEGRFTSVKELPPRRALVKMVREAARINEAGLKAPRAKKPAATAVEVPPALLAALRRDKKALAAFEAFPPSHKREYVEWITEAKRDDTRQKRIDTAVSWISEGKSRNWKYMR